MTEWARRGYELRWRFLGRPIRPFTLGVLISTITIAIANVFFGGIVLTGTLSHIVAVISSLASVLLVAGWFLNSDRASEWGLLLAVGCWSARSCFALLTNPNSISPMALSVAWVVVAGGAYLLEREDHLTRPETP